MRINPQTLTVIGITVAIALLNDILFFPIKALAQQNTPQYVGSKIEGYATDGPKSQEALIQSDQ